MPANVERMQAMQKDLIELSASTVARAREEGTLPEAEIQRITTKLLDDITAAVDTEPLLLVATVMCALTEYVVGQLSNAELAATIEASGIDLERLYLLKRDDEPQ